MIAHATLIEIPPELGESPANRVLSQREYARLALRECATQVGAPLSGWSQANDGRPLPNAGWHWSVSHSRMLAGAVVAECPIGIDIEHIRPRREDLFDEIAEPHEWDLLGGRSWLNFFMIWTAKEATLKANGRGIGWVRRCRLTSVEVNRALVSFEGKEWPVRHLRHGEYVWAVAGCQERVSWDFVPEPRASRPRDGSTAMELSHAALGAKNF